MERQPISHALIHVMGLNGVSVGHSYRLGLNPCGRFVTALTYELLPCGGARITQYSEPAAGAVNYGHSSGDETKHFIYPASIWTGKAEFELEN